MAQADDGDFHSFWIIIPGTLLLIFLKTFDLVHFSWWWVFCLVLFYVGGLLLVGALYLLAGILEILDAIIPIPKIKKNRYGDFIKRGITSLALFAACISIWIYIFYMAC